MDPSNFVANPSFENSLSYVAAPDGWGCDVASAGGVDRSCFADSSMAKEGRRSGRFASGANFGAWRVEVPISGIESGRRHAFSAWVRGDCAGQKVTLRRTQLQSFGGIAWQEAASEEDITSVVAGSNWTRMEASIVMQAESVEGLAFAVSKPGLLWIDDVRLVLASSEIADVLV